MKLRDFGVNAPREWFQQIMEWSSRKITFEDNIDCVFVTADLSTSETVIGHSLGRVPKYIIPVASWPNSVDKITLTKAPTNSQIYLSRATAGKQVLMLIGGA